VRPHHLSLALLACAPLSFAACASLSQHSERAAFEVHTFREEFANVHLVVKGDAAFLVDAGLERSSAAIIEAIRDAGVDPASLRGVIVTHGHADHAGGARALHETFGVPIIAGRGDEHMMANGANDKLCPTGGRAEDLLEEYQNERFTPLQADVLIDEPTDLAQLVGVEGQVLPVPGHTPGSIAVIAGDSAFVGDLFRGSIVGASAETHFYMCDVPANTRDIRALLDAHPGVSTYFTGHFGPVDRESVDDLLEDRAAEEAEGEGQ
jgi:glyoxylase-like metal-dependent hydrolase (beta-lactamase superfamily II)